MLSGLLLHVIALFLFHYCIAIISFFISCRYACDRKIVSMLRDRSLGNGPFQMMRKVKEAHTEAWLEKTAHYTSAVEEFVAASERGLIERPKCEPPPAIVEYHRW